MICFEYIFIFIHVEEYKTERPNMVLLMKQMSTEEEEKYSQDEEVVLLQQHMFAPRKNKEKAW